MCADDPAKAPVLRDKPNRRRVNHGGLPTIEATGVYRHRGRKLPRLLLGFSRRDLQRVVHAKLYRRKFRNAFATLIKLYTRRAIIASIIKSAFRDVYAIVDDCEIISNWQSPA